MTTSAGNSHRQLNMVNSPQPVWPWKGPEACQSPVDFTQPWYTQDGPLYQRWRRLSQSVYGHQDLRPVDYKPIDYPWPLPPADPVYLQRYPYWGSSTLYYRPFFANPSGACIMNNHCIDGTSPGACTNFENDKAHLFAAGKTCRELKKILGPNFNQLQKPSGTSCKAQPQGCTDWN